MGTSCLDVGGRLVRIERGRIVFVHTAMERLAAWLGLRVAVDEAADPATLLALARAMAHHLV